ncbi:MAG TPA: hemerythrin domain-containing protein [Polyangiaceae bacterium]
MNIIDLLKQQHEEAKDLLDRIIDQPGDRESRALGMQVAKALRLHMQIEEKLVYPTATRAFQGDEDDEEKVLEAYEEHTLARHGLMAFESTAPSDKRYVVRAKVLKELLEKHIEEEEKEFFPELESKVGEEALEKLGAQLERKLPQLEAEAMRSAKGTRGRAATGTRTRAAAGPRRTRATGARSRTAKPRGGARTGARKASSTTSSGSRQGNGKPRRGESTSRS